MCPAATAERPEVRDGGVGGHRVRAAARARPLGAAHRLPPGQVHPGDDRRAVPHEEEDGPQRHVLHPLPVHPRDRDQHQLCSGIQLHVKNKRWQDGYHDVCLLLLTLFCFLYLQFQHHFQNKILSRNNNNK